MNQPAVVIILGSENDEKRVDRVKAEQTLRRLGISYEISFMSAHRNKEELRDYCREAVVQGTSLFIELPA